MPAALSSGAERASTPAQSDPAAWGLVEAAASLRAGRIDAESYAGALLERCTAGAHLNAFVGLDPGQLLARARAADAERRQGRSLGPLHGLPIALKDNIEARPWPLGGGTAALRRWHPQADAMVVERLVAAGALLAGKTTMHELAMGWTGQNAAFGDTRNPHDPQRMAGGSSGGSACAVAAGMVPAAIGTDTNGSVRVPAAFCGIAGLRPTHGRYPLAGVMPLAPSLDTVGPMARCVEDLALLDAVMAGAPVEPLPRPDPRTLRLGICRSWFWERLDTDVAAALDEAMARLARAGVAIVDVDWPQLPALVDGTAATVIACEAGQALSGYLRSRADAPQWKDLLAGAGRDLAQGLMPLASAEQGSLYEKASRRRERLRQHWSVLFDRHRLDALVHPAARVTAPLRVEPRVSPAPDVPTCWGRMPAREAFAQNVSPASLAGAPSLVLPAPAAPARLPVGLQLDGRPGADRRLLQVGATVEALLR